MDAGLAGTGSSDNPLRADFSVLRGVLRRCNNGAGTQEWDGSAWGPCTFAPGACQNPEALGCSSATAVRNCKVLRQASGFAGGDGTYWVDPDDAGGTPPFQAWCDMTTEGGGWTRVFSVIAPARDCVLGTGATADPRTRHACAKLADTVINQLASEKIFYTQIEGAPKLFTKYTGALSSRANAVTTIGRVVNQESYAAVQAAAATYTPTYSAFILFTQHNWYQTDTLLGSQASSCRFSLEYLSTDSSGGAGTKYACCAASCASGASTIQSGWMTAYVK